MPNSATPTIVLSIAGYDPSAGAGILADLKTFSALRVYGMACITALTVQSTQGVFSTRPLDADTVLQTLQCLAGDVSFSAIKVGMLGTGEIASVVLDWLVRQGNVPVVLDPVLRSSSGKDLLDDRGRESLKHDWLARVDWLTPNLQELAVLTGQPIAENKAEVEYSARILHTMATQVGNQRVHIVVTGGHAERPDDLLLNQECTFWFAGEHVSTSSTHGTGCTFSAALAARVALGDEPGIAVQAAKDYVTGALRNAYPVGRGHGPLNHFWQTSGQ